MKRAIGWFAVAAFAAGAAQAQPVPEVKSTRHKSEWELEQKQREWKEGEIKLPAYPRADGLVEFAVSSASSFRFFIDPVSLEPGPDGVVRYTLIARSPSGVANVSYEGIRCATNSYRVYALGNEGRWTVRPSEWRDIEARMVQRWHNELRSRFFCPSGIPIASAAEGLDALRRGVHPGIADRSKGR